MAVYANFSVDSGITFTTTLTVEGLDGMVFDLTGYTARGQIRKTYLSTTAVDFVTEIDEPVHGKLILHLSAVTTAAMKPGRYQFDVEILSDAIVMRVVEGQIEVNPRITRPS
jgi:hypothetical protein